MQERTEAIHLQRERERNEQRQCELAAKQLKEQEKLWKREQAMLLRQEKAERIEKLIKDYRKLDDAYGTLRWMGDGNAHRVYKARENCADELCGSKDALHYLQAHDKDLFREMNQRIKEQEKEHVIQEKQKVFELELTR
jgi:hypothetical protein